MAQFTITLRQILADNINIFDFDYPIFDESYRPHLEKIITNHYMFNEIGFETVARFIHELNVRMNEIMPYYNKLYESDRLEQRILDNYDVTETIERSGTNTDSTSTSNRVTSSGNNIELSSDTPQCKIDINSTDYVNNINKNNIHNDSEGSGEVDSLRENHEKYLRTMKGNIGVQTDADAINKYRTTLLKIDNMVISDLRDLFMQVF